MPASSRVAEGAMARELRDRYADMADVLADLDRIKAGKAAVGPHGISRRVKQLPFSLWIPGGGSSLSPSVFGCYGLVRQQKQYPLRPEK